MLHLFSHIKDYLLEKGNKHTQAVPILEYKRQELLNTQWPFFVNLCTVQVILGLLQIVFHFISSSTHSTMISQAIADTAIASSNVLIDRVLFKCLGEKSKFKIIILINFLQSQFILVIANILELEQFNQGSVNSMRIIYLILLDMVLINVQPLVVGKLVIFLLQYLFFTCQASIDSHNFSYRITILFCFFVYVANQESKFRSLLVHSEVPKIIINSLQLPIFVLRSSDLTILASNQMFQKWLVQYSEQISSNFKKKWIYFSQVKYAFSQFVTIINEKQLTLAEVIQELKLKSQIGITKKNNSLEFRGLDESIYEIKFSQGIRFSDSDCILVVISNVTGIIEKATVTERTLLKSRILKSLSHELRTRKNIVQGLLKMYLDSGSQKIELIHQAYYNSLIESNIISSIINYNLCLEGQLKVIYSLYNLDYLIKKVIEQFKYDFHLSNIQVSLELDSALTIITDQELFTQILTNLVNNSIKYLSQQQSPQITIKVQKETLNRSGPSATRRQSHINAYTSLISVDDISMADSFLVLTVTDNGIGVSESSLSIIRDVLQNDNCKTRSLSNSDGFFLGLRSCSLLLRQLNQQHGSFLDIRSIKSHMTEVSLRFRLYDDDTPHSHQLACQETKIQEVKCMKAFRSLFSLEKCRCKDTVLVVDDEPFNLVILQDLIERFGFNVDTAGNGYEALEKFRSKQCHTCQQESDCSHYWAVLMDYQMPIMNGVEAARQMAQLQQERMQRQVPIVGCTAFSAQADIQELLDAGMIYVCVKPINKAIIKDVLDRIHHYYESSTSCR